MRNTGMKKLALLAALSMGLPNTAPAQDAPWGCHVLLCAASSAPSWQGVPSCVPPMTRLIAAMKLPGFSWPTCPQAGTGAPGHEPFEECPTGYKVYEPDDGNGKGSPAWCKKPDICSGRGSDAICKTGEIVPRPIRQDPYYFDIRNSEGQSNRHWFNLRY
ncbi:hypothetical protein CFBP6625_25440 (plasmid) [Agrobacterium tumefaciens]|nr:hypothetical protein CFBP6625_25440 [Agrobacterium tumefaciens]